jgi:hypothetical protein
VLDNDPAVRIRVIHDFQRVQLQTVKRIKEFV